MFSRQCLAQRQAHNSAPEAAKLPSGLWSCGRTSSAATATPSRCNASRSSTRCPTTSSVGSRLSTTPSSASSLGATASISGAARARRARGARVQRFLVANDFTTVHASRESRLGRRCFPLHDAVRQRDAQMVALLLEFGANPTVKNSAGQTPEQLARCKNMWGSHDEVLRVLGEALSESTSESDEANSRAPF
mmetsp:Transcript_120247/g.299964  ORF Transcript_120247/g.299964 Transcript_120247/m.299964 type:complete len:192 (-) Transcript_120247:305-880(-)